MLVLSRRTHESVVIGGTNGFEHLLKVTVIDVRAGMVKLGIEIDAEVPVHRMEVWERLCAKAIPDSPKTLPCAPVA